MPQPTSAGRFIWQDLMTDNTAAATEFYPKVVGWETRPWEGGDYILFSGPGGTVGGVMQLPEEARAMGAKPHWLPYIGSSDVDHTVAAAQRLGGKLLKPPTDIPGAGRYAVLVDPQGASFGVFKSARPSAAATGGPKPGDYSWHELATSDSAAVFDFYSDLFGWKILDRVDMGPSGTYLIYGLGDQQFGGIFQRDSGSGAGSYWLSYVAVDSADSAAAAAVAAGGRIAHGPVDVPGGGRIAQLLDPLGVLFAVHAAANPVAAPKAAAAKTPKPKVAAPKSKAAAPKPKVAAPKSKAAAPKSKAAAPKPKAAAPKPVAKVKPKAKAKVVVKAKAKAKVKPKAKAKYKGKSKTIRKSKVMRKKAAARKSPARKKARSKK